MTDQNQENIVTQAPSSDAETMPEPQSADCHAAFDRIMKVALGRMSPREKHLWGYPHPYNLDLLLG